MKYCLDCGIPLPNCHATRLRCAECAKKRHNMLRNESKRRVRRERNGTAQKEAHEQSVRGLADISRLASEAGLSYGQYVSKYRV